MLRRHANSWREDGPGWALVVDALDRAQAVAEREGFVLHVSSYPLLSDLDDYPLRAVQRRLATACEERELPFHDLLEPLQDLEAASLWAHPHDHHPNAACNRHVATYLADRLEADLLALLGERD